MSALFNYNKINCSLPSRSRPSPTRRPITKAAIMILFPLQSEYARLINKPEQFYSSLSRPQRNMKSLTLDTNISQKVRKIHYARHDITRPSVFQEMPYN